MSCKGGCSEWVSVAGWSEEGGLGWAGQGKKKIKEKRIKTQYKDICMLKFIMCNYNNYNIVQPGI